MAACFEYHAVVIAKSKETTNLPVAADATCSGVQVISALLKDEKAAALVNIIPSTEGPADLSPACAEMAPQFIDEVIANFKKEETREALTPAHVATIKKLISGKGARKLAKPVVMTTPYSATASTQTDEVIAVAKEQGVKLTWLQGYTLTMALRKALYVVAPSMEIMEMVASEVAAMAKATGQTIIEWTSPSGHKVAQYKPAMKRVRVNAAGKALVMNQIQPGNNPSGHGSAAMPNFVHSLDSALLHKTFADVVVPFGLIHDSVLTRATDMDATLAHLKFTFVEIFSEDIFSKWAEEIGLQIDLESLQGDLDITQVMQSEYFFS
jgi:DNA-directed RNA polymerase